MEAAPIWLSIVRPLLLAADTRQLELVTSAVTLLEVLVVPYRANNHALAVRYENLLTQSRGIQLIDVTRAQLRWAAQLRALTGIPTPDALQLSAAREAGCMAFVTNHRRLPEVSGLRIAQLADHVRQGD
jgi:predicted nucleic acid-binding protein